MAPLVVAAGLSRADVAAAVSLHDQYGEERDLSFPREHVSVLLIADRKGSGGLEPWIASICERYEEGIDIEGVALLKGVPRPLRGLIRKLFRSGVPHPVMLDWTNESADLYDFDPNKPNLFVITRDGRIHLRINGASDEDNKARCFAGIDELL